MRAYVDNFDLGSNETFQLRCLVDLHPAGAGTNKERGDVAEGPLVVYTGNEGPIEDFARNTGAVYTLAAALGGRAVFVEQRYFGKSIPPATATAASASTCGESLQGKNPRSEWEKLSTEQVLADLANVISVRWRLRASRLSPHHIPKQ
jgi:hypothetical protein